MRTCPYCAEEIPEDSVTCRYCGGALAPVGTTSADTRPLSALPAPPSAGATSSGDEPLQFSHSGERYLLGYSADAFGIWDRLQPGAPVRRFPRTDDGWRQAWGTYAAMEPRRAEVALATAAPAPQPTEAARAAPVNGAWWLLPILLGWLGGLIAWLVNKDTNQATARAMLFVGIGISLLGALLVALALPSIDGG